MGLVEVVVALLPLVATVFFAYCCCGCFFPKIRGCGKGLAIVAIVVMGLSQVTYWTYGDTAHLGNSYAATHGARKASDSTYDAL
jgi:hypothetical protein